MTDVYTWAEVETAFVQKAATGVFNRYKRYGITKDDCVSEIHVWLYGRGGDRVRKWLANSPQQTTRIYRSFYSEAQNYAEREKAQRLGYEVDDVAWYSPSLVEAMLPLALDPTYDCDGDTNNPMMISVIDIRRALEMLDDWVSIAVELEDSESDRFADGIRAVVAALGGPRPFVGRRRPISNAHAAAITGADYGD